MMLLKIMGLSGGENITTHMREVMTENPGNYETPSTSLVW